MKRSTSATTADIQMKRIQPYQVKKKKIREGSALPFILPGVIPIFAIILYPLVFNLYLGFFKMGLGGITDRKWVGIQNIKDILNSKVFWQVAGSTVLWVVGITFFIQAISLLSAILLNQKVKGSIAYRTIQLLPWVIPAAVIGFFWKYMFDSQFGVINDILIRLGLIKVSVPWLSQTSTAMIVVMLAYIWKVFPLSMIMILGSLQGIPDEIYEAAVIDGAGHFQLYRYVVIPLLSNIITLTTILMIILSFNSFDLTYIMTGGGPVNSSEILGMYIFDLGFKQFSFGSAATTASLVFIISFGLILVYIRAINRKETG
jgi:multiple sugar transport system permease protein